MATAGPNYPGSASGWTNSGNAGADDGSYATTSIVDGATSASLVASSFGFGIPDGSTINGIAVEVQRKTSFPSTLRDNLVQLRKGGTSTGNNKADTGTSWGTSDATITYGGASDLWGTSWAASDINASNFGVDFRAKNHGFANATASVDFIRVTVYYTEPVGQPMVARARAVPGMRRAHGPAGW